MSDFALYMEEPYDKMLSGSDPFDEDAKYNDPFPDLGIMGAHIMTGRPQVFDPDTVRTVEDIDEGLDLLGVDHVLITPGATVFKLGAVFGDDMAVAIVCAFNDFTLEKIADENTESEVLAVIAS